MFRMVPGLLLASLMIVALLPGATAFPAMDEVEFTYAVENDEDEVGASGQGGTLSCALASLDPLDESNPCELLKFEIGNSDEYVFFQWTLGSTECAEHVDSLILNTVRFTFPGEAETADRQFDFKGDWLGCDGVPQTTQANPAAWKDKIEWDVVDNRLIAAVPIALLDESDISEDPVLPGSNFTVSLNPKIELNATLSAGNTVDEIELGNNVTFVFSPYLGFQAPRAPVFEDVTGFPLKAEVVFDEATTKTPWITNTYQWNWTMDHPSIELDLQVDAQEGSASIRITDAHEVEVLGDATASTKESVVPVPPGEWTIEIQVEKFVGRVTLTIEEGELPDDYVPPDDDSNGGTSNGAKDNETEGGANVEDQSSPGPAGVVLVVALLAVLYGQKTRRR